MTISYTDADALTLEADVLAYAIGDDLAGLDAVSAAAGADLAAYAECEMAKAGVPTDLLAFVDVRVQRTRAYQLALRR